MKDTIARIPHGRGERRIHPRHDQSPICAHFDGNHTVGVSIRRQGLPDYSRSLRHRSTSAKTCNETIRCLRSWLQRVSRIRSFHCHRINSPETGLSHRNFVIFAAVNPAPHRPDLADARILMRQVLRADYRGNSRVSVHQILSLVVAII